MKHGWAFVGVVVISGCAEGAFDRGLFNATAPDIAAQSGAMPPDISPSQGPGFPPPLRPVLDRTQVRPDFPPPPPTARTAEQFDTTSPEDRAAAVAEPAAIGERRLGTTVASLGSPTEPGFWLKTPLVTSLTQGRVAYNGKFVSVELRPSGGAPGSGSQISLSAMRLLGAPLTGLPEVVVYAN